jgi:hypothetical protein
MTTATALRGALVLAAAFAAPVFAATATGTAGAQSSATLATPRTDLPLCSELAKKNVGVASSASPRANANLAGSHPDCVSDPATPASGLTPVPKVGQLPDTSANARAAAATPQVSSTVSAGSAPTNNASGVNSPGNKPPATGTTR